VRRLAVLLLSVQVCSCGGEGSVPVPKKGERYNRGIGIVDPVKVRKDPKGGWLGSNLRDVYLHGEDSPAVFCGSGPEIPTV